MILVCPTCRTRYKVDDEAVSRPSGRTVRCASCGHSWHYMTPPPAPPTPLRERIEAERAESMIAPRPAITAPPPAPPAPLRERIEAERAESMIAPRPAITAPPSPRHRRGSGFGWVVAILLIGGAIAAAVVGRNEVVAMWPQAGQLYELVGLRIGPLGAGLSIANVSSTRNADGLIVEGDITNKVGVTRVVPRLRVALRDASQHELIFKIIDPPREKLLPGETSHFVVGFLPAPDAAVGVLVTFSAG